MSRIDQLDEKTDPKVTDEIVIVDSEDSPASKRVQLSRIMFAGLSQEPYGVQWDPETDNYQRLGVTAGLSCGASLDDALLPIQSNMKRCVLNDAGEVVYMLQADDSNFQENGDAADLTGGDGQVMVRVPKFYYKQWTEDGKHNFMISPVASPGFELHPAFLKAGVEVPFRYIGAYPATLYDDSASSFIDGDGAGGADVSNDKLSSISGKKPWSDQDRGEFRTLAENRGNGWHQFDWSLLHAIQLLYLTEYADFNIQSMIGAGNTDFDSFDFATCIAATGKSDGDGNTSANQTTTDGDSSDYVSYRGIEDIFGNIWQFIDGININNSTANGSLAYVCNNHENFADDTASNYEIINRKLQESDDYPSDILATKLGILPKTGGAGSTTGLCDKYYTSYDSDPDEGWRVLRCGGRADGGSKAGVFYLSSDYGSASSRAHVGGRLCF